LVVSYNTYRNLSSTIYIHISNACLSHVFQKEESCEADITSQHTLGLWPRLPGRTLAYSVPHPTTLC